VVPMYTFGLTAISVFSDHPDTRAFTDWKELRGSYRFVDLAIRYAPGHHIRFLPLARNLFLSPSSPSFVSGANLMKENLAENVGFSVYSLDGFNLTLKLPMKGC
jgi:hypothetical protein